jgi:uncharacterized protein (TIGR00369 family)
MRAGGDLEKPFMERMKEKAHTPPIAVLIGMRPLSVGEGESVFEMKADRRHHNPMGTVHGGILCDLADAAMGYAFASTLGQGESFTTLELKINFIRPVFDEKLTAKAKVVQRGKTLGLIECDVLNEEGKMVARASSSCLVLRGDDAKGR